MRLTRLIDKFYYSNILWMLLPASRDGYRLHVKTLKYLDLKGTYGLNCKSSVSHKDYVLHE